MNRVSVFEVLLVSLSRSLKTINNMKNSGFTFRKRLASFRYAFFIAAASAVLLTPSTS